MIKDWAAGVTGNGLAPEAEYLHVLPDAISEYRVIADDGPARVDVYVGEHAIGSITDAQSVPMYKTWLARGGR